jgi:phosphate uptake regulator
METRKVQVTGGSTFTVSLPKGWADDHGVQSGSTVAFYTDDDTLVLSPDAEETASRVTLDINQLDGDDLATALLTSYVGGFDIISIEANRISADQRSVIRTTTLSLIGLEVLEETFDRVVIQDLLDSAELSIDNAVTRMRLIAISMLDDAVTALCENDDDLAHDVIGRDDEADRLWFAVSRLFRESLRSPAASEELGLSREVCFEYQTAARQLERIGDHAVKIAQLALDLEDITDEVSIALRDLHEEAEAIVSDAMDALYTDERSQATDLANDARRRVRHIDEHTRTIDELLRELGSHEAQQLGLVIDSLSRTADYGGNIAETALQKAAPTP